jgi:hypothetical protein
VARFRKEVLVPTRRYPLRWTIAILVGCAPANDQNAPRLSDSLGVSLIDYATSFAASSSRAWATDAEPVFSIGGPPLELYQVRVALFQSGGGFVVANGGSQELLLFDREGTLRARVGGEGGGPGEFHQLTSLSVGPGDSLYAYDDRERRISVFDLGGVFARAVALRDLDSLGSVEDVGVLRSGAIVGAFRRRTPGTGLVRDSLLVTTLAPFGQAETRLGTFAHLYVHWGPHPMPGGEGTATIPLPVPLSSVTAVGWGDAAVYVGIPEPYALIRVDLNGRRRVTRQAEVARAATDADRERLFATLATGRLAGPELDILRGVRGPEAVPAFGVEPLTARIGEEALLVTDRDGVWLRPFALPDDSAAQAWPRFDADGLYEGTVTLPARFRATAVRGDVVLGVYRDEADVEYVRAYRVVERR